MRYFWMLVLVPCVAFGSTNELPDEAIPYVEIPVVNSRPTKFISKMEIGTNRWAIALALAGPVTVKRVPDAASSLGKRWASIQAAIAKEKKRDPLIDAAWYSYWRDYADVVRLRLASER